MLSLLLALPAIGLPPPPVCPWDETRSERLLPVYQPVIPRNASIWQREYGDAGEPITLSPTVAADLFTLELSASGGRLLELRPRELLAPNTDYGWVRTTSTTDDTPPATPVIRTRGAITSPTAACSTAGIFLDFEAPAEPVFYAIEDADDGSLIEVGTPDRTNLVPTEPFATFRFRVVAIDVAGNRSPPTEVLEGRAQDVSPEPSYREEDSGCRCLSRGSIRPWFVLALVLTWARVRRQDVRSAGRRSRQYNARRLL